MARSDVMHYATVYININTFLYSSVLRRFKIFSLSFWEDSNNLIISKLYLNEELDYKNIESCEQINFHNFSQIYIKQEPCQVAELSSLGNIVLKQDVISAILLAELNCSIYKFENKESLSNISMDNRYSLEINNDTRIVPCTINSEILLNGTNSIIPFNDNQIQASFELYSLRASNGLVQYPIAVHQPLLAMQCPSLGVQLLRDHNPSHFLIFPSSSSVIDNLHPTIIWPSFQQSPQTTQLPHIVFPNIQQTLPTSFSPLHLTGSDFLTSTTLHQHTQTRLVAVSTSENKKRMLIRPKPQQNALIKLENKSDMKHEYKSSELPYKATCQGEKFFKSALQFSEEEKDSDFSRIQHDKSTQINSVLCETIPNTSVNNNSNSQDNVNEISEIFYSSEFMQNIGNDYFCYNETNSVECSRCPFIFEKRNCNFRKEDDNIKEDSLSKNSAEVENNVKEKQCNNFRMECINDSNVTFSMTAEEKTKVIKSNDACESITHPIDFSGLELLSNISTEATKGKILNLKKEMKKDESIFNNYCREEVNNETNKYINGSLETLQSNNCTLDGLNLLCALAEQRIQEEDNKAGHYSPRLFKKRSIRKKKPKIIQCNKIKKINIKYKKKSVTEVFKKEDFKNVFKEVKSKYNCCNSCRNKRISEISACLQVDAMLPTVAEIFRVMELKMAKKLASIINKNVERNAEIKKTSFFTYHESLNTNLQSDAYETEFSSISSDKVKSRTPSPSKNQTDSIKVKSSSLLAENNLRKGNPILFSKNSVKETLYDINDFKSLYNNDKNSKCISKVKILPSLLTKHLSSQMGNVRFNDRSLLMGHINSNNNKGSRNNSIILRLQKSNFNNINFTGFKKSNEILTNMRLCKLIKSRWDMKKLQKHKLMKQKLMHTEEKKKIIDGHLRISDIHLKEAKVRVLTAMGGLFYAGYLQPIEPPDVYAVTLDGERGNKPHIMCRDEVLRDVVSYFF